MKPNSRFTNRDIDADMALDKKARVVLLGRDDSARETVQSTLASLGDAFDITTYDNAQRCSNDNTTSDIALVVIIASGDGDLDSHWVTSLAELHTLAPLVLVDTDSASFDARSTEIAWRHLALENHAELNSALDTGQSIGRLRLALAQSRDRQSLMSAGIAAILNQNDTASAALNGATLEEPTPALAGLLGASSIDRVAGSDVRDWIKDSDRSNFSDVLKQVREQATAADAVVRIITTDDVEYGTRISMAPLRRPGDETSAGDIKIVVASADNRFRPDLLAYSGHDQIGGRMALHNALAAPRNQAKQAGYGLIAVQIDNLRVLEDNHGLAATEIFAHRFGLALAESLNDRDRLYRTDIGRFVVFVERGSAETIRDLKDLSESLQASLTDRRFNDEDHASTTVTISVCHIELDEGADTGWTHDDRLARVLRGVEALSRLGGNNYGHHGVVAALEADEARLVSKGGNVQVSDASPSSEPMSGSGNGPTAQDWATETGPDAGVGSINTEATVNADSQAGKESDFDDLRQDSMPESVTGQEWQAGSGSPRSLQLVNDTNRVFKSIRSTAEQSELGFTEAHAESSDLNLTDAKDTSDSNAVDDTPETNAPSASRTELDMYQWQSKLNDDQEGFEHTPWTNALRQALEKDGFSLAYQGVTSLSGIDKPYFEVLLRYVDDTGQLISAGEFLADAERSGLMPRIDRWVTDQALYVISDQREANKPIGLFVKLSPRLLPESRDFLSWLVKTADERRVERGDIIFSFRESDINYYGKRIEVLISALCQEGFKTALTHVSRKHNASILLGRLSFNFVKLSASFAHSIISDEDERPLHQMIEEMHRHNVPFIADQIEDADAMAKLWQAGINYVQGYFIQEPDTKTFPKHKDRA